MKAAVNTALAGAREGKLPIVIGVTGHRDLRPEDCALYRARARELFADLRRRYPGTPLRVISALAEGADRLIAEEALDAGHEVVVPLPFDPSEYERDFPPTVAEFRTLLARVPAEHVFVVAAPADSSGAQSPAGADRDAHYAAVGAYIANHCHILVAVWDGFVRPNGAGTSMVVGLKLSSEDGGPVYHVRARRAQFDAPPDLVSSVGECNWTFPEGVGEATLDSMCSRLDRFNSDPARDRRAPLAAESAAGLLPELEARPVGDRVIATTFGWADQLANHYRRVTHGVLRAVLLLAAALALTFELYAEIFPERILPTLYLGVFAAITVLYYWQKAKDAQGRYLDYRAVAEGLRVQFYWRLAGLPEQVSSSYLRKQLDELRWIREALRGAGAIPPTTAMAPNLVLGFWMKGQTEYYRSRAVRQERRFHRIERNSARLLATGLAATASLVLFWGWYERMPRLHHWVVLVMGFAPIGAALCEAYAEKFGLRTQANQYARFAAVFGRAERIVERWEADPDAATRHAVQLELVRELGREALMENGDWVLLLRERPIVLPKG